MNSTHIVVDLGFGDAGKGTIVDALARRCPTPPLVVRFNGGAQAGHNVHTSDGRHHTFSQFGAATFVPGSRTLLSEHTIFHPAGLLRENEHLRSLGVTDAMWRLLVDQRALVVTPYQQAMNRLREFARGKDRHGTCGLGIGETVWDSLEHRDYAVRVGDLRAPEVLMWKMEYLRDLKLKQVQELRPILDEISDPQIRDDLNFLKKGRGTIDEIAIRLFRDFADLRIVNQHHVDFQIRESEHIIFEGAQGILLDEWYGFHPHTTWSTTTTKNADALLEHAGREGLVDRIGVVRAYSTRHGQGPFPTEDAALTRCLRETTNSDTGWQGQFRAGMLDAPLLRYALETNFVGTGFRHDIDHLAVTCLDRVPEEIQVCDSYEVHPEDRDLFDPYSTAPWVPKTIDLTYQERLTKALFRCRPGRTFKFANEGGFLPWLETVMEAPVTVVSRGPTAEDKVWTVEA